MTKPAPLDTAALAGLNDVVTRSARRIADAQRELSALRARRGTLQAKIDRHEEDRPAHEFAPDPALVASMVSSPGSDIDAVTHEELQRQQESHAQALRGWNADAALLASAAARLDQEIADADSDLSVARDAHATAWSEFVRASHAALAHHFREAFRQLRAEVLEPMLALQYLKDAERNPIVPRGELSICRTSELTLDYYGDRAQHGEKLLCSADFHPRDGGAAIERFRATLAERAEI